MEDILVKNIETSVTVSDSRGSDAPQTPLRRPDPRDNQFAKMDILVARLQDGIASMESLQQRRIVRAFNNLQGLVIGGQVPGYNSTRIKGVEYYVPNCALVFTEPRPGKKDGSVYLVGTVI